jgi:hypothetical protein
VNGKERIKLISEQSANKEGFRLVNLECLEKYITEISVHCMLCKHLHEHVDSPIELIGEVWHQGLASIVAAKCKGCGKTFELKSPRMRKDRRFEVNVRAVWSQMVTGGGASRLSEQCATMGMNGITQTAFTQIEDEIGSWWKQVYMYIINQLVWLHMQ